MTLMTFKEKLHKIQDMFYPLIKPLLFAMDPEKAHELILQMAHLSPTLGELTGVAHSQKLEIKVGSLVWKSPVGLAAGLDKNAEALPFFSRQGFGALEIGTVTLKPQVGNPRPRMFRYPEEESLRNSMGFPNAGLLHIARNLEHFERRLPVGANIGKNKDSTPEESIDELSVIMATLSDDADYFVVNVSSPNTPGLRALQEKSYLKELFTELLSDRQGKDLYLKIAPDLDPEKIIELTELAVELKLTGLIATNTTIMPERGTGGVSGKLLTQKARQVRKLILDQKAPIELIGVGGFSGTQDLLDFWRDGGKACQIYSSYIFQGPCLLKSIQKDVLALLDRHQLPNLSAFFALPLSERQKLLV